MSEDKNETPVPANEASEAGKTLNDPNSTPEQLSNAGEVLKQAQDSGVIHDHLFG